MFIDFIIIINILFSHHKFVKLNHNNGFNKWNDKDIDWGNTAPLHNLARSNKPG